MMFYSPRSLHKKRLFDLHLIYFGRRRIFSFSNIKDNKWTLLILDIDVRFVFLLNRLIYTEMHASFYFVCDVFINVFTCSHPLVELWLYSDRQGSVLKVKEMIKNNNWYTIHDIAKAALLLLSWLHFILKRILKKQEISARRIQHIKKWQ